MLKSKKMDTCLSYFIVIIIFNVIYMNDNESLKSIIFIAETCEIHTRVINIFPSHCRFMHQNLNTCLIMDKLERKKERKKEKRKKERKKEKEYLWILYKL